MTETLILPKLSNYQKTLKDLTPKSQLRQIWIDVGAHHGQLTLNQAISDLAVTVYAFEPNLTLAAVLSGNPSGDRKARRGE